MWDFASDMERRWPRGTGWEMNTPISSSKSSFGSGANVGGADGVGGKIPRGRVMGVFVTAREDVRPL